MRKSLFMLLLLAIPLQSVWAAGCYLQIGTASSAGGSSEATLTIPSQPQSPLPSAPETVLATSNNSIYYWGRENGTVNAGDASTVIFTPNINLTADTSNSKGWLADPSIPGLYFTLSVVFPPAPIWGTWDVSPVYLSQDNNVNRSIAWGGWGCNSSSDTLINSGTANFKLDFYTTAAFDPAKAAGKKIFAGKTKVGTIENKTYTGGDLLVYIQGPMTITTIGCAAFKADEVVSLGETTVEDLYAMPTVNQTPFSIKLQNCYGSPALVINVSSNQIKNNLLVNTSGTARGVGVGLTYYQTVSGASYGLEMDMTNPLTLDASSLNYDSSGNGTLNMAAHLAIIERSALTGGTVNIPTVITLTHP